jgi:predicted enzyme involved in methoxymalonyl-ACP biosynthesis
MSAACCNRLRARTTRAKSLAALEGFGLADYFLHPQIAWTPKSDSVRRLAVALDLGIESFVFIDDQPFERGEVQAAHPGLRVMPQTGTDYLAFLRGCAVTLDVAPLLPADLDRVY